MNEVELFHLIISDKKKMTASFCLRLYDSPPAFPGGSDSKGSACNARDLGSIPGLGRSPGEGKDYPSSILAWRIPWTEEPGRLYSPWGSKELIQLRDFHFHFSFLTSNT